ncbi:MAG: rod shape-determining protein RodA [Bacteroidetes bacterium]|nr:MAG: rod shape-determining protein RodA [Bacteroidota bacterium]
MYLFLVFLGWLNIFAAVYDPEIQQSIFDLSINSGKQLLWIGTAALLIFFISLIDHRFFETFAFVIYGAIILLLIGVLIGGKVVAGSKSWIEIGSFALQPSEFAKFSTALALSAYLSKQSMNLSNLKSLFLAYIIIFSPAILILLQNDTGSTLVFSCFMLVLYREGMNPTILVIGIVAVFLFIFALIFDKIYLSIAYGILGLLFIFFNRSIKRKFSNILIVLGCTVLMAAFTYSVDFFVNNVLQLHQQNRIKALINPDADPLGFGWNVTQSKIAIGSGGFLGKGFLEGTQTKFDFVPEQHTDFIFCTIGEEWGWIGTFVLISIFVALFLRIIYMAERQRSNFARIYGYCVASIMFFHFMVNIGMTIGLFPVIGIPLPFFSYGGSSLWSFTILFWIFLNLDANRKQVLG